MDVHNITLIANDDTQHHIDSDSAKRSKFITDLLVDFQDEKSEIRIAEANGQALKEIIDWLIHYKEIEPKALKKPMLMEDKFADLIEKWDIEFIERNKNLQKMQDLIVASDYMGINHLHELLCCYIASVMKDLGTSNAIIKHFGIDEDMTEEEMRKLELEELEAQKEKRREEFKKRREQQEEEFKKAQELKNEELVEEKVEEKKEN